MSAPRLALPLLLCCLASCEAPMGSCAPLTSFAGSWVYEGSQDTPTRLELLGVLSVSAESCAGFQGQIDIVEAGLAGQARRLTGPIAGRLVGTSSTVRLEAYFDDGTRLHLAELGRDSLAGGWLLVEGGGGHTVAGSFVIRREGVR